MYGRAGAIIARENCKTLWSECRSAALAVWWVQVQYLKARGKASFFGSDGMRVEARIERQKPTPSRDASAGWGSSECGWTAGGSLGLPGMRVDRRTTGCRSAGFCVFWLSRDLVSLFHRGSVRRAQMAKKRRMNYYLHKLSGQDTPRRRYECAWVSTARSRDSHSGIID